MTGSTLLERLSRLPQAADSTSAARYRQDLVAIDDPAEAGLAGPLGLLLADSRGKALLNALFGNSPFLADCVLKERRFFLATLDSPPGETFGRLVHDAGPSPADETEEEMMARLRVARRRVALLTAICDIGGVWTLFQVTRALTEFAERAVRTATAFHLRRRAELEEIELPYPDDPERGSGLAIIGMGKLGAGELNYSSDIDLVVFFDEQSIRTTGKRFPRDIYSRVVHGIVKALQERTADGYVFRTDLRLRPDAGATPVAMTMATAEVYYESLGQNWERAAMIKARTIAGDLEAGRDFLHRLAPFIWRRNLDFAAIADIHSIKRQIHAAKGHRSATVAGHDIKVGAGGIREIEFFAQTQQLIAGGRDRRLRISDTCGALRALVSTHRLDPVAAESLIAAYEFLRTLEHRLQMVADEQTQRMPSDPEGIRRIGVFMGYASVAEFERDLRQILATVQTHYSALFENAPTLAARGHNLVFTGTEDDPETIRTLREMGFQEPARVAATIRGWHHGRVRAMRAARARELMTELVPPLLKALSQTAHPDLAFRTFDDFLGNLPAGVQILSLIHANPHLLEFLALIMGTAPRLAEVLGRTPALLDALISPEFRAPPPDRAAYLAEMQDQVKHARDMEDVLDVARRFAREHRFQIGARMLRDNLDVEQVGFALTDIAEAVLEALIQPILQELARTHGQVAGGEIVVVGLGKLGAREMTFGSDLDLIIVYDHAEDAETSDGAKPLSPSVWFSRFTQRYINALTALTAEGQLYEVDMRLRPSGNKGPIAVRLEPFERYHRDEAWTWEHMALSRARVLAGSEGLRTRVEGVIAATLTRPRDSGRLLVEVGSMRRRIAEQHGTTDPWDVKYAAGGLIDLEFLAQYHLLAHATSHPAIVDGNTARLYERLAAAKLLPKAEAKALREATLFLRAVQNVLRLCITGRFDPKGIPPGLGRFIAKVGGTASFAGLAKRLATVEAKVADRFAKRIALPAAALEAAGTEPIVTPARKAEGDQDVD